jgi:hypothetical protein
MPVARRVAKTRITPEVDDTTWGVMTDQIDPSDLEGWDRLVVDLADVLPPPNLVTTWRAHADQIVSAWAMDHPGTRPSCWWRWDAPEPRKIVAWPETAPDADAELVTMFIESEAGFLRRHDLLLDGEAALLTEADYAPQEDTRTRQGWQCAGRYGENPRRSAALRQLAASEAG